MSVALRLAETPSEEPMRLREHTAVQSKNDYFMIDPRKLKVDPDFNVREMNSADTKAHIADLKRSIAANGVKVPLEVRLEDKSIFIVSGHCRHQAVLEAIKDGAEIAAVPCIPEKAAEPEDRIVNLILSNSGKPLAPLEIAQVVKRLIGFGWTEKKIAERLGWKSSASVKQHIDMLALPEPIKDHVRKGNVSATAARNLAKSDLSPEDQKKLLDANVEENKRIKGKKAKVTPKQIRKATAPKPAALPIRRLQTDVASLANAAEPTEGTPVNSPDDVDALARAGTLIQPVEHMTDAELEQGLVKAGYLQASPDQASARASCEGGFMAVAEYLRLCEAHGWMPDVSPARAAQGLAESTQAIVREFNGWTPDTVPDPLSGVDAAPTRAGVKELIAALEPFANIAHDIDFNERSDDEVTEVPIKHLKQAWIVFARVCGEQG